MAKYESKGDEEEKCFSDVHLQKPSGHSAGQPALDGPACQSQPFFASANTAVVAQWSGLLSENDFFCMVCPWGLFAHLCKDSPSIYHCKQLSAAESHK